eukprot:1461114-Prymnesium_polylepis.1
MRLMCGEYMFAALGECAERGPRQRIDGPWLKTEYCNAACVRSSDFALSHFLFASRSTITTSRETPGFRRLRTATLPTSLCHTFSSLPGVRCTGRQGWGERKVPRVVVLKR